MSARRLRSGAALLLCGFLLLASACSAPRPRADAQASPPVHAEQITEPGVETAATQPQGGASDAPRSPWQRLRERFAMPGCDYSAAVQTQARRYAQSPARFSASWQQAMPLLLLVVDELEKRNLPGELALLPYVESHYRLVPGKGGGPAGAWQLMPRTAVDRGLRVDRIFDERLDMLASTRVALDLLERLHRQFDDWRLATMAYNAGEFRIKAALRKAPGSDLSAASLEALKLSPVTHQHLARVLGLACLIGEPERFGVTLPAAEESDFLENVILPQRIDPALAARLAGLPAFEFSRYNASASASGEFPAMAHRILLPKTRIEQFRHSLSRIPEDRRGAWQPYRVREPTSLAQLSSRLGIPVSALAAANAIDPGANLHERQDVIVPSQTPAADGADVHVVRRGDTLSDIARHYGLRLAELMRWNALDRHSILRIGAPLQLRAPAY